MFLWATLQIPTVEDFQRFPWPALTELPHWQPPLCPEEMCEAMNQRVDQTNEQRQRAYKQRKAKADALPAAHQPFLYNLNRSYERFEPFYKQRPTNFLREEPRLPREVNLLVRSGQYNRHTLPSDVLTHIGRFLYQDGRDFSTILSLRHRYGTINRSLYEHNIGRNDIMELENQAFNRLLGEHFQKTGLCVPSSVGPVGKAGLSATNKYYQELSHIPDYFKGLLDGHYSVFEMTKNPEPFIHTVRSIEQYRSNYYKLRNELGLLFYQQDMPGEMDCFFRVHSVLLPYMEKAFEKLPLN